MCTCDSALTSGRIGSDYQPQHTAVESVFWAGGVINPVLGLFVGPTGNRVIPAGSAQCGQTVWIAVVRMQMNHADSTAMGSDDRPMMICARKRERAEEREPRGQCYCREFHDFVAGVVCTTYKWTFDLIFPLKSSLSARWNLMMAGVQGPPPCGRRQSRAACDRQGAGTEEKG
jgi:hypothetical protein